VRSRWVLPAVAGLVALTVALIVVGVVAMVGGGDDRPVTPGRTPADRTGSADPSAWVPRAEPQKVVVAFLRAVKQGDCAAQESYVTEALIASSGGCTDGRPSRAMRWTISDTKIHNDTHTATVTFDVSDTGSQEGRIFALVPDAGTWRISDFHAEVSPKPTASPVPTDLASGG
jgi:hypothetical protein